MCCFSQGPMWWRDRGRCWWPLSAWTLRRGSSSHCWVPAKKLMVTARRRLRETKGKRKRRRKRRRRRRVSSKQESNYILLHPSSDWVDQIDHNISLTMFWANSFFVDCFFSLLQVKKMTRTRKVSWSMKACLLFRSRLFLFLFSAVQNGPEMFFFVNPIFGLCS